MRLQARARLDAIILALALGAMASIPRYADAGNATADRVNAAVPKIEAYAAKLIDSGEVPGLAIAVVFDDRIVDLRGFGVREAGKPEAVDADTIFQVASLSKPISAIVVAALVSAGKVDWNARIADLDPGFRLFDPYPTAELTVRDLFSHRSGLPGAAGNDIELIGYDRDAILHRLRLVPAESSFRSQYSYSNFGITEGGVAAAKAAGLSWEDAADAMLFRPLGMKSTSYRHADFLARADRAALHSWYQGKWQPLAKRDPDPQAPAGGASSSVRDMAEWVRLLLANGSYNGKPMIKPAALAPVFTPLMTRGKNPVSDAESFYGLGWNVRFGRYGLEWGHAGAFSQGARTVVSLLPEQHLGIVVLSNAFPTGVPEAVADTFFDLVMSDEPPKDWLTPWNASLKSLFEPAIAAAKATYGKPPGGAMPPLPLAAYAGTYTNPYVGDAIFAEANGRLEVRLGPDGKTVRPLTPFNRDVFVYYPFAEAPDFPVPITFRIGAEDKASEVFIENLDEVGFGRLKRVTE